MKTASEFITFFETIPACKWCVGLYSNGFGKHCATGHLGATVGAMVPIEVIFLQDILGRPAHEINDGKDERYQQKTPKARILAALRDAEEKTV